MKTVTSHPPAMRQKDFNLPNYFEKITSPLPPAMRLEHQELKPNFNKFETNIKKWAEPIANPSLF